MVDGGEDVIAIVSSQAGREDWKGEERGRSKPGSDPLSD